MAITMTISPGATIKRKTEHQAHIPETTYALKAFVIGDPLNGGVVWDIAQGGGQIDQQGVFYHPVYAGTSTVVATAKNDPAAKMFATIVYV